jgi:hypothetical protein
MLQEEPPPPPAPPPPEPEAEDSDSDFDGDGEDDDDDEEGGLEDVSRAFPSCMRSILTEMYRCHCSWHAIDDGNAPVHFR